MRYKKKRYFEVIFVATLLISGIILCRLPNDAKVEVVEDNHTIAEYDSTINNSISKYEAEENNISEVVESCLEEETTVPEESITSMEEETTVPEESESYFEEQYTIPTEKDSIPILEENSIYITGTDINKTFTISSFTQEAVDKYDIVYSEGTKMGANDPFILGHDYKSLGILYQTKVGANIYLCINGNVEIYEVVVSEYGLLNASKTDIIGQTTQTSIWHNYDCKTLHLYTCYGNEENARWIVLAKKIS